MFRRFARKTLRYLTDLLQIKGVLAHAALPEWGNRRLRRLEPIRGRLPPAGRCLEVWSLKAWKFGQVSRCAAITKGKGRWRTPENGERKAPLRGDRRGAVHERRQPPS